MTADQAARWWEQAAERLEAGIRAAVADTAAEALALAQKYSEGPLSYADLAAADHPYALRHGEPLADPSVINVHRGASEDSEIADASFLQGWQIEDHGDHAILFNDSPEAPFLEEGTSRMFARPIAERVEAEMEPVFQRRMEQALDDSLRR